MQQVPSDIQTLCGASLQDIIATAENVLRTFVSLGEALTQERTGFYLTLMDISTEEILATVRVGVIPSNADDEHETIARKYWTLSIEKARRLAGHIVDNNHVSSAQSADPEHGKYPGAIRGENLIISISGLPPHGDEAVSLEIAKEIQQITDLCITEITAISGNDTFAALHRSWVQSGLAQTIMAV